MKTRKRHNARFHTGFRLFIDLPSDEYNVSRMSYNISLGQDVQLNNRDESINYFSNAINRYDYKLQETEALYAHYEFDDDSSD